MTNNPIFFDEPQKPLVTSQILRVVAVPFSEAHTAEDFEALRAKYKMQRTDWTQLSLMYTEHAERLLRQALEAGERPEVALVMPNLAVFAPINNAGELGNYPSRGYFDPNQIHHPQAHATVHTTHADGAFGPQRASTVASLRVAHWLAPVADQLGERYGVPVSVGSSPDDTAAPNHHIADAVHIRGLLPPDVCAELVGHYQSERSRGRSVVRPPAKDKHSRTGPKGRPRDRSGDVQTALQLLQRVGSSFGLPVNNVSLDFIRTYTDGEGLGTHTDLVAKHPWTWDRTVSFSILLSDRKDFTGGDLIVNGKTVRTGVGDLVGFTSVTPHGVTPVTRGTRYVWLGSGEALR